MFFVGSVPFLCLSLLVTVFVPRLSGFWLSCFACAGIRDCGSCRGPPCFGFRLMASSSLSSGVAGYQSIVWPLPRIWFYLQLVASLPVPRGGFFCCRGLTGWAGMFVDVVAWGLLWGARVSVMWMPRPSLHPIGESGAWALVSHRVTWVRYVVSFVFFAPWDLDP